VVNIKGITQASWKLTGPVLGDIFLGKITNWTDPAISLNPYAGCLTPPSRGASRAAPAPTSSSRIT
jgi:phosphate transport system substrate-binding protein